MIRFADKFVLVREIGSGGMSTVFLGRDEVLDRPVAIKLLKPGFGETDIGARFRREGRTAARLSHPNIVQVYDAGEDELDGREVSYIVMEYVPGGDLKALIDEQGRLSGGALAALSGIAAGLAHAHERGVIHRDIKPHNILLEENGRPKLADFGIARALGATYATRTGSYLGTALYSSPEQLRGEGVTPKSDIYSLGVTLYHAATGQVPFTGTPIEVASQHVSRGPTPPRQVNDAVSESLEALILDCLRKDPASRPTADEVRRGLLEAGRGVHATRAYAEPSTPKPSGNERGPAVAAQPAAAHTSPGGALHGGRRDRRRGALAVLALVALVVLVGVIVVSTLLGGDQSANVPGQNGQNLEDRAQGGENRQQTPQETSPGRAGGGQDGLTAEAAEQTVQNFYTSAVRGDIGRSYELLTVEWRQQHFPTQADLKGTFRPVQDVTFIEGPTAEVSGDTATVTGVTRAELSTQIERNEGIWTLVNENGEWRIREWTVNRLSTRPT